VLTTRKKQRPRSLSGHELVGDQLLRFVYMDEAGISSHEPVVLVAAIIVDADRQWRHLADHIQGMIDHHLEEGDRENFVFHAKDLFHGTKKFPRDKWSLPQRLEILKELVSIPRKFNVPLTYGFFRRGLSGLPNDPPDVEAIKAQHSAFISCAFGAEQFMRNEAGPREVATIVAEDNPQVRAALKHGFRLLKDRNGALATIPTYRDLFPVKHIIDTVHFAAKNESILLQIADACAFVLARFLSGGSHVAELYESLTGGSKPIDAYGGHQLLVWKSRFGGGTTSRLLHQI